jgi:modulator of FtsH protease
MAYNPGRWHDAYVMLGSAAAALTGLVFVALSIHLRAIVADRFQRARGHYLTFGLIYLTVVAALVLIPGQGDNALGIELLVGGFIGAAVTGIPFARMTSTIRLTVGFSARVVAAAMAIALDLTAGASLLARSGGGLYYLMPALLLALVTNVSGAWALLIGLATDE